jgi:hypothetical protein
MPLWGLSDNAANSVKTVASSIEAGAGATAITANNTALYGNVSVGVFPTTYPIKAAVGQFGVSYQEMANTAGERNAVCHAGWNIRRAGTGPVRSITVSAGGVGYNNTDIINISGGQVNAAATPVTNSTGSIVSVIVTTPGTGFANVSSATIAITNSTAGASAGSNATLVPVMGGRAGRVTYESIVAMGSMSNGATDDTYLPQ